MKHISPAIAILDAGSQYAKLIDKQIHLLGVKTTLLPLDTPPETLREYEAVVISGGPDSVYESGAILADEQIYALGKPILGICYGMQMMTWQLGGRVESLAVRQDGVSSIRHSGTSHLLGGGDYEVLLTHGDGVIGVPEGFEVSAYNDHGVVVAMEDISRQLYGVQFHPEVCSTPRGAEIFARFVYEIAGIERQYTPESLRKSLVEMIREEVGEKEVIALLSGGVDSTVAVRLLAEAISPDKIHAIHVDHGCMRLDESAQVLDMLQELGVQVHLVEGQQQFLQGTTSREGVMIGPLSDMTSPEDKRAIIGDVFMDIVNEKVTALEKSFDTMMLLQGTLRPDLIESASKEISHKATVIKTHHNDTHLVRALREAGHIIEPLKDLHKDEVRQVGRELGLSSQLVDRHPFPGPGLAVRILCSDGNISPEYLKIRSSISQFGADILPVKSVTVQGDGRKYLYVSEFDWKDRNQARENAEALRRIDHRVGRSVIRIASKGNAKSLTPTYLTPATIHILQQADEIVREWLHTHNYYSHISQCPVILLPVSYGAEGMYSVVIRPFITDDFMTGFAAQIDIDIQAIHLEEVAQMLLKTPKISAVLYDCTDKPPGTVEWE